MSDDAPTSVDPARTSPTQASTRHDRPPRPRSDDGATERFVADEGATATAATGDRGASLPKDRFPVDGWDRYGYVGFLGAGGMGAVYKAWDPRLKRHVALKFLSRTEPVLIKRFTAEAQAQARVDHAHVCKVFEVGDAAGRPYIAMQCIDGDTLAKAAVEMTLDDKLHVVRKIADAVHAAHRQGLIHRDLKPSNVMVERTESGRWLPYVLDFGIARDLVAPPGARREVAGTPHYMAPEQAKGQRGDRRTDVYGLGATLFAVIVGRPPSDGTNAQVLAAPITEDGTTTAKRTAARISDDLATVLLKCLDPAPDRRYPSAAAMAEDLRRLIEEEPITARPPSLLYRAGKRLRKARTLAIAVAVAVVAVVALTVLAVRTMRAHDEAERRVELAQRFGQEVGRLEALMRQAYTAPLHDIRRERAQVLARVAAIEDEARRLGGGAIGPAAHAAGRVYLSLHDYQRARERLEAAWDAGLRTADVRYALGLAFGLLYQEALAGTGRIDDERQRERERASLQRTLRDPALEHLAAARGVDLEAPAYVEGLIAFCEGDHALALAKAGEATAAAPLLYEARKLAGDTLVARARIGEERGEYGGAADDLAAAALDYDAALAIAPSDPGLLSAVCAHRDLGIQLARSTRTLERGMVETAAEPCRQALRADPALIRPLLREAAMATDAAEFLWSSRGEDPRPMLERALAANDAALVIDPESAQGFYGRATVAALRGRFAWEHGEDPEASFIEAHRAFERSIALDPRLINAYADQCFFLKERADWESERGVDPRPTLAQAIAICERGHAIDPQATGPLHGLATAWLRRGDWESEHGLEPLAALTRAIEWFQRELAINPNDASGANNLGLTYDAVAYYRLEHGDATGEADLDRAAASYQQVLALGGNDSNTLNNLGFLAGTHAHHLARSGGDPRAVIAEGLAFLRRALEVNPNELNAYFNSADLRLVEAEYLLERGDDPTAALTAARAATAANTAGRTTPDIDALAFEADAWVLAARWAIAGARSPAPAFASAERVLARAEQPGSATVYVLASRTRLERWRADWLVSRGADAGATLAAGSRAAAALAALDHGAPETRRLAGELALLEARAARTATARRAAAARAIRELEAAKSGNRFLTARVAGALDEASRLAAAAPP